MPHTIVIPSGELYDEENEEFLYLEKDQIITIEHSLLSISKWESKTHKIYLDDNLKLTREESIYYIKCMTLTQNVNQLAYKLIDNKAMKEIQDYMLDPYSATYFNEIPGKGTIKKSSEKLSSEVMYYYMFKLGIPKECEKWHINRLQNLIRVFAVKDNPDSKMTKRQTADYYRRVNAQRRAKMKSKG